MYNEKEWWKSKTVWGGVIAVVAGVAGFFGISVTEEEQGVLVEGAFAIASAVGGILAILGRKVADTRLK